MRTALAAVLALATMGAMSNPSPQPTITISPMPPHQGGIMEVSYDGPTPVTLEIDWDPAGTPTSVTIPRGKTKAKVKVPANATSVIVTDPVGGAPANGSVIAP